MLVWTQKGCVTRSRAEHKEIVQKFEIASENFIQEHDDIEREVNEQLWIEAFRMCIDVYIGVNLNKLIKQEYVQFLIRQLTSFNG